MKKGLVYIFFLLILLPCLYAIEKERIYSAIIYQEREKIIDINGQTFTLNLFEIDQAYVDFPSGSRVILENSSCRTSGNYYVCLNGSEFWYRNYTLIKDFHKANIDIYKFKPENIAEIKLTRIIADTDLIIDEQTRINAVIKNIGRGKASNIAYSDSISTSFLITDISGCIVEYSNATYNTVKWSGSLNKNQEQECNYKIKALSEAEFESKAFLSYYDGDETKNIYSDTKTINVLGSQLNVSSKLDKSRIKINEEANLYITLTNLNDQKNINIVSFTVEIPLGLEKTRYSVSLKSSYTILSWQGILPVSGSKSFNVKLKGKHIKEHTIKLKTIFIIEGLRKEIEKPISLEVYGDTLSIDSKIDKTVQSSEESNIIIEIKNPSSIYTFRDIKLTIESLLPNLTTTKSFNQLNPLNSIKISDLFFTAPEIKGEKEYPINISIAYKSEQGQILKAKEQKIITVIGKKIEEEVAEEEVEEVKEEVKIEKETKEVIEEAEVKEEEKHKEIVSEELVIKPKDYATLFYIVIIIVEIILVILVVIAVYKIKNE